jgi:predicted acyl esterase
MLIEPHTRLDGPQLAGWTPRITPFAGHRLRMDAKVSLPMPDGVRLRADVYRPQEAGRYPALVYAPVLVSARGIEGSGGTYDPWFSTQEQRDMADAIAWVAEQPWCAGKGVMMGISYFAISQLLAAARRPPALEAIFPYDSSTDVYRHILYHGGLTNTDFDGLYACGRGRIREK